MSPSGRPVRIGRYELLDQIGQGGMGTVYRARDPELGRDVAIKLLEGASAQSRARFTREAEGLARLQHPNVVRVHEVGEEEDRTYLVMELVEGEDLERRLDRDGPLAPEEAARIGRDLASAVEHAHGLGILHRDLKPANVLMVSDGRPLLTDFGLAHLGDSARLTRTGTSLGTPGYWPPEQALGKREQMGPASDVYGLGATLYALLSGVPPVVGETIRELLVATCDQTPSSLQPQVDPALDAIVLRCLAKSPSDRYPSAGALGVELGRYLAGERTSSGPASGRGRRFGAGVLVLALACVGAWALNRSGGTTRTDPVGTTPTAHPVLPPALVEALDSARADDALHRWKAAESALSALPRPLDAQAQRALLERGGAPLVVLRLYREGRISEACSVSEAAAERQDGWAGRAWRALSLVREARAAFGRTLRLLANISRRDAPRPEIDGLLPTWVALHKALEAREALSPKLGSLRDDVRAELRATAVGAVYLLDGPARDHEGERRAFEALRALIDRRQSSDPRPYDRVREFEQRIGGGKWIPAGGDPNVREAEAELSRIPGPAAEVLRIGCLGLLARNDALSFDRRVTAARAAAALALRGPDRPLGLSVRLGRAWRLLTGPVIERVWVAVRERRPPPYDLDRLQQELGALRLPGQRAMLLFCLGRVSDAEALERTPRSALDAAIRVQAHLLKGETAQALQLLKAQDQRDLFSAAEYHVGTLMKKPSPRPSGRGLESWFPWHTPSAVPKILSGEWWWPGEGPVSGG